MYSFSILRFEDSSFLSPPPPPPLHTYTPGSWELQVELEDFNGNCTFVHYGSFCLLGEADHYQLVLGKFSEGTAGERL